MDKITANIYGQMCNMMDKILNCSSLDKTQIVGLNTKKICDGKACENIIYNNAFNDYAEKNNFPWDWKSGYVLSFECGSYSCGVSAYSLPFVMRKWEITFRMPTNKRYRFSA